MKIYRYDYAGVVYSIVDHGEDTSLIVNEIAADGSAPANAGARLYHALHMLDAWRRAGRPGEILAEGEV